MKLSIKNIGKIESADIRLDGITVICGENNTGKSTIGKVLFSYFNSMCGFENKVQEKKEEEIRKCISKYSLNGDIFLGELYFNIIQKFIYYNNDITIENVESIINSYETVKDKKELSERIYLILSASNKSLINEYIFRYFMDIFNNQIQNENCDIRQSAFVETEFRNGTNNIKFYSSTCNLIQEVPVIHCAYYINNPFVVDYLNVSSRFTKNVLSELDRNIIDTIKKSQHEQLINKMAEIFDAVENKDKLKEIRELLSRAYSGRTIRKNNLYFYNDGNSDIEFRNLSTGLKSFALIERLLESGKLKSKDVLILDEPEIHLHPEWQLVYAEIIVILQKKFDLTVLITTHSPYFLEAIDVYSKTHNSENILNYYLAENTQNGCSSIEEVTGKLNLIYEKMYYPLKRLDEEEI